jgi:hypothetical protein
MRFNKPLWADLGHLLHTAKIEGWRRPTCAALSALRLEAGGERTERHLDFANNAAVDRTDLDHVGNPLVDDLLPPCRFH